MKKTYLALAILVVAGSANAADIPSGVTGLWRFQSAEDKLKATIGTDLTTSDPGNSAFFLGPWTVIDPGLSDGGVVQETSYNYLTVTHGIAPNGGGAYVNQYTVAIDYIQTSGLTAWNSLFQTAGDAHANDGDLFTDGAGHIGIGATGYSTLTYDANQWHRIIWSVDNGNFFNVYVDGTLFLNGAGQPVDGRFSLDSTFELFADNDWEDQWGLVSTAIVWNRALTGEEVAAMGGATTSLTLVPEPGALSLIALSGLLALSRRVRK